jgi:drug/metabolite transporter (DMT)-like permease
LKNRYNAPNLFLLLALMLIWGSSYILIKRGLSSFSPIQLACLRLSIAGLFALPVAIKALPSISRHKYLTLLQIGLVSSGIPAYLFALSMTKSESSINGILNSLSPLMTVIIGYFIYKVEVTQRKITGVFIGFTGAALLILGGGKNVATVDLLYALFPVIATFVTAWPVI